MTYTELQDVANASLTEVLKYPSIDTPIFWPLILFTIFITVTLITFFRELGREGKANFLSSIAVAGYLTTALAVAFTFLDLIMYQIVVLVFVISLVFQVLFMLTKKE